MKFIPNTYVQVAVEFVVMALSIGIPQVPSIPKHERTKFQTTPPDLLKAADCVEGYHQRPPSRNLAQRTTH